MAVWRLLWYPSLLAVLVWGLLRLDRVLPRLIPSQPTLGGFLVLVGVAWGIYCTGLLARLGKGSPHPFTYKTKQLVLRGPYRFVRNLMMWAVGTILLGASLWLGSTGLLIGFAGFVPGIHLFVTRYEEHDLERRFGEAYREYCRRVPRWWPKWHG